MAEISDFTKDAVWNTLCDLEWHIRYFSAMHEQKRRRYRFIRLTLLLGVFLDGFLFFGSRDIQWLFYVAVALGVALAGLTHLGCGNQRRNRCGRFADNICRMQAIET